MFRKSLIAIAATIAIAIAALPSTASAKKWKHHHYGHGFAYGMIGLGLVGAAYVATCNRYQWVETRYGWRQVLVNVCD
jgi:hypothetical protein